jgi:hypothetical protein
VPKFERIVTIGTTRERVFEVLERLEVHPDWNPFLISLAGQSGGKLAPGSRFVATIKLGRRHFKAKGEVSIYLPPRRLRLHFETLLLKLSQDWRLETRGAATEVTSEVIYSVKLPILAPFVERLTITPFIRRDLLTCASRLKELVESPGRLSITRQ